MIKAVFFDLDGTLCDTLPDLTSSLNYALRMFDLPVYGPDQVRSMIGNGVRRLCSLAIPCDRQSLLPQVLALFRAHYASHCTDRTQPYPGIPETVSKLSESGILLGVITNKPQAISIHVISECFKEGLFMTVLGQTDLLPLKPDPALLVNAMRDHALSPSEVMYAGDSDTDLIFAKNACVTAVGCAWGYRGKQFLLEHGALNVIDRPEDLLSLFPGKEG